MSGSARKLGSVSFKLDDIHDAAGKIELMKIVQCVNCNEIPIRPIMSCENGHILCSSCRALSERCHRCKSTKIQTRNRVAENVIMSFVFKCKYRDQGCERLIPWGELLHHMNHCNFRPVQCYESLREKCNGKHIPYNSYIAHLKEYHGIRKFKANTSLNRSLHCNSIVSNCRWPGFLLDYDEEIFFQNVVLDNSMMFLWITIFKPKKACEYTATVTLKKIPSIFEITATFPVQNFRISFEEIRKLGYFICLPKDQLIATSAQNVRDDMDKQIYAYSWSFHTEITRIE